MSNTQQVLQELYNKWGILTPELVVEVAKDSWHPLHDRFEWDDTIAAEKFRLVQAARVIRSVRVTVHRGESKPPIRVRAFVAEKELFSTLPNDQRPTEEGSYYRPVEEVILDDGLRNAWLAALARDWHLLKRRAGDSKEFADLVRKELDAQAS